LKQAAAAAPVQAAPVSAPAREQALELQEEGLRG